MITLIVVAIIVVIAVIGGALIFSLTKEKTSITASDFYSTMQQKGYVVQDAKSQFADYDYVKQVYIATNSDYTYKLEFYELEDVSYAISFYKNNKSIFENSKGNVSAQNSVEGKNHAKYTLSSNGQYMVVSRINNTVIFVRVEDTYRDTIKSILEELGYQTIKLLNIYTSNAI